MTIGKTQHTNSAPASSQERMGPEELKQHARTIGVPPELIKVQDNLTPDCVTVAIRKPDGRTMRRIVPRESWSEPAYRSFLIRDMAALMA